MICPKCAAAKTRVGHTEVRGAVTIRLRYCTVCRFSFNSIERPNFTPFTAKEIEEYEKYVTKELTKSQE